MCFNSITLSNVQVNQCTQAKSCNLAGTSRLLNHKVTEISLLSGMHIQKQEKSSMRYTDRQTDRQSSFLRCDHDDASIHSCTHIHIVYSYSFGIDTRPISTYKTLLSHIISFKTCFNYRMLQTRLKETILICDKGWEKGPYGGKVTFLLYHIF